MTPKPKMSTLQDAVREITGSPAGDHEEIRRRAYELYERRGKEDGRAMDDWLQAESEVTEDKTRTAAA